MRKCYDLIKLPLIPDLTVAMLKGSATFDLFMRSKRGTNFHSIYLKTISDKKALFDQSTVNNMAKQYEMVRNGYALIRPFGEIHSLMTAYPCQIVFPAKGLKNYKFKWVS